MSYVLGFDHVQVAMPKGEEPRPDVQRAFVADPFGNRIELINAESAD